jgi:predicted outer membrane repeat protein
MLWIMRTVAHAIPRKVAPVLLGIVLCPALLFAATYEVTPDGTGDFPTIQAALDAAGPDDIIELTPGTFIGDGNRDLDYLGKAVTIRSATGDPATCVLDCQGSETEPHRGFRFHSGELATATLSGVSVVHGYIPVEPLGAAILCEEGSSPSILSCIFSDNSGSAVVCASGASPDFVGCAFMRNHGSEGGGAACDSSYPTFSGCTFQENSAEWSGGAVHGHACVAAFTECDFVENTALMSGAAHLIFGGEFAFNDCRFHGNSAQEYGAMLVFFCTARLNRCTFTQNSATQSGAAISSGKMSYTYIQNCTFWGNAAPEGTLYLGERESTLDNCIIAFGAEGPAMGNYGPSILRCCDIYGNAGGDWVGYIALQYGVDGNISEDPLFCDPEHGDFQLRDDSPCAPYSPSNPECDLVGAWPVGCGSTATKITTWGALKARFR